MLLYCRDEQAAILYQNIHLIEPRVLPQYERVIINFIREIKLQNSEMENLALAVKRWACASPYPGSVDCMLS